MLHIENELISYEIKELLVSYNFEPDSSYIILIKEIIFFYSQEKELSQIHIDNIKTNNNFQIFLLKYIQDKMKTIINNNSCLQFKEIVNIINLLSFSNNYKIFKKYNELSQNQVSFMLRDYEKLLIEEYKKNKTTFSLYYCFYITLIDSLIQVCIINSVDIKYKKDINLIIELIKESISIIKYSISLEEKKVNYLNKICGKFLLFFSHTEYIITNDYTVDTLIYFFEQTFKKHIDGLILLGQDNKNSDHYKTFLLTNTNLLLLMLKKLDDYNENYFYKLNIILKLYNKNCFKNERIYKGIEDLKEDLLNNFVFLYDNNLNISYKELLSLILQKNKLSYNDIILIHDITLFNKNLDKRILLNILNKIIKFKQEKNDYYENYRLKIIDIILNNLITLKIFEEIEEDINKVIQYIKKIYNASHLISSFAKIHLTISNYYSFLGSHCLELSKKHYYLSKKMASFDLLKDEYSAIYENILLNNSNGFIKQNLITNNILKKDLITFGLKLMDEYKKNEENSLKYKINNKTLEIIQNILNQNNYTSKRVDEDLSELISKKIFFSLCLCTIIPLNYDLFEFKEKGYEITKQEINNSHIMIYKYSSSHENSFTKIYKEKEIFIKNILDTVFLAYERMRIKEE
ncbi:MAG: hypothetical protein MJK08_12615 [Campylobacterales bacterium]|nr:hypothetical protein [Campylobacterales bacterium]